MSAGPSPRDRRHGHSALPKRTLAAAPVSTVRALGSESEARCDIVPRGAVCDRAPSESASHIIELVDGLTEIGERHERLFVIRLISPDTCDEAVGAAGQFALNKAAEVLGDREVADDRDL